MSGFVATAPITSDTTAPGDALVNDGWFPDLSLARLREVCRLDGTVTDDRLRDAAAAAMLYVNRQLAAYQAQQQLAGKATLADVDPAQIAGANRLVYLYGRAVACWTQADLIERYRSLDITDAGLRRAVDLDPSIGEHRRSSTWAVREILGLPHTVVELI